MCSALAPVTPSFDETAIGRMTSTRPSGHRLGTLLFPPPDRTTAVTLTQRPLGVARPEPCASNQGRWGGIEEELPDSSTPCSPNGPNADNPAISVRQSGVP